MRTRTQGKGAVTPTDLARLACECLKVLCGGVGQQWTATWTGALAAAVLESLCHISPFEGQLQPYHRAWAASGQTTNREGAQLHPSVENWIKDLQNMALLTTPRFYPQPVPPLRKFAQASYPHPSEGRQKQQELQSHGPQNENHNHRKLTKMVTWIQPCVTQ